MNKIINHPHWSANMQRNKGFSLIELMVSMMIGLFLIFVVISSYSSNKASNRMRAELGELESNARIAMSFLKDGIEHAAYPSAFVHVIDKPFLTASDGVISGYVCGTEDDGSSFVNFQEASYINNNNRYTKDNGNTDRIAIVFMPDNPKDADALYWQDCTGSYTDLDLAEKCSSDPVSGQAANARVVNSYFISNSELKCTSSRNITVPIARGIEALQFRYGVRVSGNTVYRNATYVENHNLWRNVVSVHVAMLVRSEHEVKPQAESKEYLLLDRTISKNDRYLRKVYTSLIHLTNRDKL